MPTRRYIFNTLTALSLVLLLATVGLRVDSRAGTPSRKKVSDRIDVELGPESIDAYLWVTRQPFLNAPRPMQTGFSYWAFTCYTVSQSGRTKYRQVGAPYWFFILVFLALPCIWIFKWTTRRILNRNFCPSCKYNLTGTLKAGKTTCPECGHVIEKSAAESG